MYNASVVLALGAGPSVFADTGGVPASPDITGLLSFVHSGLGAREIASRLPPEWRSQSGQTAGTIEVARTGQVGFFSITATDTAPARTAALANAYAEALVQYLADVNHNVANLNTRYLTIRQEAVEYNHLVLLYRTQLALEEAGAFSSELAVAPRGDVTNLTALQPRTPEELRRALGVLVARLAATNTAEMDTRAELIRVLARTGQVSGLGSAEIVARAAVPTAPVASHKTRTMAVGALLAFIGVVGWVLFSEWMRDAGKHRADMVAPVPQGRTSRGPT